MIRYAIIALLTCLVIGCDKHDPDEGWAVHSIGIYRDATFTEAREYHGNFRRFYSKIRLEDWPLDVIGMGLGYRFRTGANGGTEWGGLTRLTVEYTCGKDQTFEIPDDEKFETWLETLRAEHVAAGQPATPL